MTPLQELIKLELDLTRMFDSDHRVAMAILDYIRNNKKSLIQKEKEVIMDAHIEGQRVFDDYLHTQWTNDQAEDYYNKTFNTKEK